MTFKHVKFEDSPTMRALEKVAKEKGLVKPESMEKKASLTKKADYTPSSDLMENIFKLCSGLRAQGLVKEASEIEVNYLNYKRAQTLYETSKEKGDDLVDQAHPKGSHKLEGVEGDEATIETILDQHLKHIQMVEKKPTGKLSNAAAIKAVKRALGDAGKPRETRAMTPEELAKITPDQLADFFNRNMVEMSWQAHGQASTAFSPIVVLGRNKDLDDDTVGHIGTLLQGANNAQQGMRPKSPSVDGLLKMQEAYTEAQNYANSYLWKQPQAKDTFSLAMDSVKGKISQLIGFMKAFNNDPSKLPPGFPTPQVYKEAPGSDIKSTIANRLRSVRNLMATYKDLIPLRVNDKYKKQAEGYFVPWEGELKVVESAVSRASAEELAADKDGYLATIAKVEGWVKDFGKNWLRQG